MDKKPKPSYPPGKTPQAKNQRMDERFIRVPTRLAKSKILDATEKLVAIVIMSYEPSFPSYEKLMEDCGISRGKLWKSINRLKELGVIKVKRKGRSNLYVSHWTSSPHELLESEPVHQVNPTSSPHELQPVHQVNSNKTNIIRTNKKNSDAFENNVDENSLTEDQIKANAKRIRQIMKGIGNG